MKGCQWYVPWSASVQLIGEGNMVGEECCEPGAGASGSSKALAGAGPWSGGPMGRASMSSLERAQMRQVRHSRMPFGWRVQATAFAVSAEVMGGLSRSAAKASITSTHV